LQKAKFDQIKQPKLLAYKMGMAEYKCQSDQPDA